MIEELGYYEFTVRTPDRSKDAILNKMSEMGCLGVSESNSNVTAFFRDGLDVSQLRDELNSFKEVLLASGLDDDFSFDYCYLSDRDWNESWKKRFVPIDVGNNLSILPPWEKGDEKRIRLVIDPGMAFGTGHHETTKTCLALIEKFAKDKDCEENNSPSPSPSPQGRGYILVCDKQYGFPLPLRERVRERGIRKDRFLDVGTGTGILAIAASKLGFREVVGVDIDPLAVDAASRNALLNDLKNMGVREGGISDVQGPFDMIAANLMSEVLTMIAPGIAARLDSPGIVILSGMLVGQEDDVVRAMEKVGLRIMETIVDGRWVSLVSMHGN
ncbi:MAG TPA: 50S ribosomal protein L11 methyltransferase [Thermodesulfovibrionales bacterium]|nr:50S ribosomal protein L11 methyltransferase [Thermodesulfovibrionales bacterium]